MKDEYKQIDPVGVMIIILGVIAIIVVAVIMSGVLN